jgi:hypothetical protein
MTALIRHTMYALTVVSSDAPAAVAATAATTSEKDVRPGAPKGGLSVETSVLRDE